MTDSNQRLATRMGIVITEASPDRVVGTMPVETVARSARTSTRHTIGGCGRGS